MSLVLNAMDGLVKNIETGSLKTRWNACHATSNMLLNPNFPIGFMKEGGIYPLDSFALWSIDAISTSLQEFQSQN